MNYQNLTEEQQKELDKIRGNIASLQADLASIEEQDPADWKTKEELQKQLNDLLKEEEEIEDRNKQGEIALSNVSKLYGNFGYTNYSRPGDEIILVSVPGGSIVRTNYGSLNNLARQMNVIFSRFECPFPEFGSTLDDEQRKELIASILYGDTSSTNRNKIVLEDTLDADNKKKDADWEIKEPATNQANGLKEPTHGSYLWFKRWFKFHQNFAKEEISYGSSEADFEEKDSSGKELYPVLRRFPITEVREEFTIYKDPMKLIAGKKMYNDLTWFEQKISNDSTKGKFLLTQSYLADVPGESRASIYNDSYEADLLYYLDLLNTHKSKNLLLVSNSNTLPGKTSPTDYRIGSKELREDRKYDTLHLIIWQPKTGMDSSRKFVDHETRAIPGINDNSLDGWNYLKINDDPKYVHRFTGIAKGIYGMLDIVSDVFFKSNIAQDYFLTKVNVISHPTLSAIRHSSVKVRSIVGNDYEDTSDVKQKIVAKRREIMDFDSNAPGQQNNYNLMVSKKRLIREQLNKLRQDELKIIAGSEQELRNYLVTIERRISSGSKVALEDYEIFDSSNSVSPYTKFQEIVKERLIAEKKLDSEKDKDWDFKSSKTIKGEDKDHSLKLRSKFEAAKKNRDEKIKEVGPAFMRVRAILGQAKGDPVKYIEEWIKDRKNAEAAQQLLKDINEIESKDIKLSEDIKEVREVIKKSDLTAKDLQGFLVELWKENKETWDRKVFDKISSYRWQGTKYNEGSNFSRLATHPSDMRSVADVKGGKKLFTLIKENIEGEIAYDIIGPMLEYRFKEYLKKSSSDRDKDYKREEMLNMLNEAENYCGVTLSSVTEGTKSAQDLKDELVKSIGKSKGEALGLDYSRSRELTVIMKWSNYSSEEIRDIVEKIPEKDRKEFIINNEPSKVHQEYVNKQMEEFGIKTEADVTKIKEEDKEKIAQLDRLEKILEKAEEKGAATEEHKKIRAAIARHKVTLGGKPEGGKPEGGKPEGGKPEGGKPETGSEDQDSSSSAQQQGDGGKETTPWWKKAGYAAIWAPILVIAAIVGVWYFAFRKPEGSEAEEGEGGTEGEVSGE